ncbi:MAG: hypothetical protein M1820_002435 [Bogoriella megaspora]|nr:MAG: hypothetical protein M1820_002435 [Bogoriella megaspora]
MSNPDDSAYQPPEDLKSRLAASYDLIAPEYNSWTVKHSSGPRMIWLNKLLQQLPSPLTKKIEILELGAGAGIPTTKAILGHSPDIHVLANDLSSQQLSLLQSNLSDYADRITTLEGDMLSLSPSPGTITAVVGMYSLIHLPRAEQSLLISRIHSWLQPGGVLLANFSEMASEEHVNENWMGEGGWVYWAGWGVDKTKEIIKDTGFEIIEDAVVSDVVDANFWWVLARKKAAE